MFSVFLFVCLFPTYKYLKATLFSPHLAQKIDDNTFNNPTKVATALLGNSDGRTYPMKLPLLHEKPWLHFLRDSKAQQRLCKESTYPECDENFSFSYRHPHSLAILNSCENKKE